MQVAWSIVVNGLVQSKDPSLFEFRWCTHYTNEAVQVPSNPNQQASEKVCLWCLRVCWCDFEFKSTGFFSVSIKPPTTSNNGTACYLIHTVRKICGQNGHKWHWEMEVKSLYPNVFKVYIVMKNLWKWASEKLVGAEPVITSYYYQKFDHRSYLICTSTM